MPRLRFKPSRPAEFAGYFFCTSIVGYLAFDYFCNPALPLSPHVTVEVRVGEANCLADITAKPKYFSLFHARKISTPDACVGAS